MNRIQPRHAAIALVLLSIGGALTLAIQPRKRAEQTRNCQSNLKQIGLAFMQYARDYDEQFPIAERWMDDLTMYSIGSRAPNRDEAFAKLFRCPTTGEFYAFNQFYARLNMARDDDPANSPTVFDVRAGARNLSDDGGLWPDNPTHNFGEVWGNNVLFADGHVKLMEEKPEFRSFAPPPKLKATPLPQKKETQ